jgi:ABC-2 type transport system permease protein
MTAITIQAPTRPAGAFATTRAVATRTGRKIVRTPQIFIVGLVQGGMFLLIFRYVFGGAISTGTVYVQFLVPGFVVTSILFVGASASAGVAEDAEQGFFDRLRSMPIPRSAVLSGRAVADTGSLTFSLAVTTAIGFLVGFRIGGTALAALAAFGLAIIYGFAFEWLFVFLGLIAGSAQAAQGYSLLVFPLTFVSSAYVPVATMPGWMQPFAENQPITIMVDAARSLCLGGAAKIGLPHSTAHYVILSLIWSAGIVAVFLTLSVWRFRRTK